MSLSPGSRLGPYEILAPLGACGAESVRCTVRCRDASGGSMPVTDGEFGITRVDLESAAREQIYRFPQTFTPPSTSQTTLTVSRDEHTIYYQFRKRQEQDILLVDHFR